MTLDLTPRCIYDCAVNMESPQSRSECLRRRSVFAKGEGEAAEHVRAKSAPQRDPSEAIVH